MTDTPCAACPSKMLPGIPEHIIEFPTGTDRTLFNAAVSIAHDRKMPLVDALAITYEIAASIAPGLQELYYAEECVVFTAKGVLSPYVAVIAARRQWTGDNVPLVARHVWLRTTIEDARHSDANYLVGNGRPDGKGGSYKATIVEPADYATCYDVMVDVKRHPCRVTKQWLDAWQEFTESLRC